MVVGIGPPSSNLMCAIQHESCARFYAGGDDYISICRLCRAYTTNELDSSHSLILKRHKIRALFTFHPSIYFILFPCIRYYDCMKYDASIVSVSESTNYDNTGTDIAVTVTHMEAFHAPSMTKAKHSWETVGSRTNAGRTFRCRLRRWQGLGWPRRSFS